MLSSSWENGSCHSWQDGKYNSQITSISHWMILFRKIFATSPDWRKTWRSACQTSSFSLWPLQSEQLYGSKTFPIWAIVWWSHAETGHFLLTWSFLKISRGTMKLSNARSSIRDRSSSIALKRPVHLIVSFEKCCVRVADNVESYDISFPISFRLPAITSSSSVWKKASASIPISSKCNHVDCGRILTWLEPMQSNLKLTRWSERLRWALDRFFAAPTRFFTSLINSFMFWLVLSSSFSWLCRLSLERKLSYMNLGRNGRNSCKTWCIDDIIIVYLK